MTTNVTTEKAKEWAASGLFLTNAKGKSSSHGFSVVLQFDLSTTPGQKGFDFYMATGIPAMGGWKNIGETTIDTQASYDRYSIPLLGTAEWREPEWKSDTIGEQGRGHEIGGGQEHQQDPTWLARKTGDRKLFSSAQLIYRETEEKESYTAVIRVKSKSGDYNQDEFAKAFFGAHATHDAQPSGEWIISAEISKRAVEDIAALRDRTGLARTSRDKARMMTKLMTERGGQMAGGLMRSGAKKTDWMVELKGDPNFPGAAGRAKLDAEKKALSDGLKAAPTSGPAVARRAEEIIAALDKRREAVADKTKYTDLPTELRDQQLALIDLHKSQFSALRQTAIQGAMKSKPGEKIEDIQKRTTRRDWHKDLKGDERTYAKLQDMVALKENERKEVDKLVGTYSRALGDVWNPNGRFAARENIRLSTAGPTPRGDEEPLQIGDGHGQARGRAQAEPPEAARGLAGGRPERRHQGQAPGVTGLRQGPRRAHRVSPAVHQLHPRGRDDHQPDHYRAIPPGQQPRLLEFARPARPVARPPSRLETIRSRPTLQARWTILVERVLSRASLPAEPN